MTTTTESLFAGMDEAFIEFFEDVKGLAWGETPDYEKLIKIFCRAWKRRGYGGVPGEIDWLGVWEEAKEREEKNLMMNSVSAPVQLNQVVDLQHQSGMLPVDGVGDSSIAYAMETAFDY